MRNDYIVHLRWLVILSALVSMRAPAFSQIVNAGVKAGFNYSWTHADDAEFRSEYNTAPVPGFNAGAVFSFQVKKRYYLHTEILYTTKGRIVTGDLALRDET